MASLLRPVYGYMAQNAPVLLMFKRSLIPSILYFQRLYEGQ